MNSLKSLSVILFAYFAGPSHGIEHKQTEVDVIIDVLNNQFWSEQERPCLDSTLSLLNNVKNYTLWAVWIWNSIPRPTGQFYGSKHNLGSYDQCVKAPSIADDPKFFTQYCLVDVRLTEMENVLRTEKKRGLYGSAEKYINSQPYSIKRDLSLATWGVCLPAVCQPVSIAKIVKTMYSVNPLTPSDPVIDVNDCQMAGVNTEYGIGFYVFMTISGFLIGAAVISTYCFGSSQTKAGSSIVYAFNIKRNAKSLFNTPNSDMLSLHYLKGASIIFITCVHTGYFKLPVLGNGLAFDEMMKVRSVHENILQRADIVITNYLLISSILLMRSWMSKRTNPLEFLIARYFRLIGSFALMLLYTTSVLMYTGDGPLWNRYAGTEQKACQSNWWLSILMLNNYVNGDKICQPVSWYLQCDYHLAAMGVLLLCLWQRNRTAAKVVTVALFMFGVLAPGVKTYCSRLPGTMVSNNVDEIIDVRSSDVYVNLYTRSHYRVAPYLLGMAMGYLMSTYKPENNRRIIPKKWSILAIIVCNTIALRTVNAASKWCLQEYNPLDSAIYAATNNIIWTVAMCVNIAVMEYGDMGNELHTYVQFRGWFYLSRLGYGIYLIHSLIMQRNVFSARDPLTFDLFVTAIEGFGVLSVSAILSIPLWIFVDAPLGNLTNLVLKRIFKPCANQNEAQKEADFNGCILKKNKVL